MATPNKRPGYDTSDIIQKEQWSELSTLLQDGGLSDAEQCGAVEAASKHCAESIFLSLISPHCTSSQLHSALPHLASRGLWRAVGHVLQRGVSTALLTRSVHQAARQSAQQELLSFILPHCAEDQLDSVLAVLVKRGLWRAVGVLIQRVQGTTRSWAIDKACQEAGEDELVVCILPVCSAVETACSLVQVVARGLWRAVGDMLQRGVSDTLCVWTLQEAFTQAECELIRNHILPHCTHDHLNRCMSYLISTDWWNDVDKLLRCVEENMSTWSVEGRHVDSTLLSLIVDRNWSGITALLHKAIEDSFSHAESFITAENEEQTFAYQIFSPNKDGLWEPVTTDSPSCVWRCGGEGFPSCWSHLHSVLVAMCFELTDIDHLCVHFYCAGHQLDSVFTDCVMKCSSETDTSDFITLGVDNIAVNLNRITGFRRNASIADLLGHMFTRNVEWALVKVSQRGPHKSTVPEILTETAGFNKNQTVDREQMPTVEETESESEETESERILSELVAEERWRDVGAILTEGVDDSQHEWLVHIACLCAMEEDFVQHVLPHCSDRLLDSVLTVMVVRRAWKAVVKVLRRGVSDSKKRWAVLETCNHYAKDVTDHWCLLEFFDLTYVIASGILFHCADDMLDSVVTILTERHLWWDAFVVLERGVSDSKKWWVVKKALEDVENGFFDDHFNELYGFFINIIAHGTDDVLEAVVKGRQWRNVGEALKRNVSDSVKRWAVQEACVHYRREIVDGLDLNDDILISDYLLILYILPHCADAHLQSVLPTLAEINLFKSVKYVLKKKVSDIQHRKFMQTVCMRADESLIKQALPCYVYDDIRSELGALASRGLWKLFLMLLRRFTIDTLHLWAIAEDCSEPKERVFWDMVSNPCDGVKELSPTQWRSVTWSDPQYSLNARLHWDTPLCEVLCEALLATVREIWLSGREKEVDCRSHTAVEEARSVTENVHQQLNQALMYYKSSNISTLLPCIHRLCQQYAGKTQSTATREPPAGETDPAENSNRTRRSNLNGAIEENARYGENASGSCPLFQLHFLKYLTREYYRRKAWTQLTDAVLVVLTTTPVVPGVQSVALRIMVREKRWDVIRHACLSCVCEQDRRQVFQAAVKQRQWGAVKRWADYSLYDDQRLWALGEAKEEKRWDVYLKLASHGLKEGERMGVLYRVAMHADWKLVRHMVNTVADVSHMKDLLTNTRPARQTRPKPVMCRQRIQQLTEFKEALKKDTNTLKTLKTAAKRGKWQVVLYNIRHKPDLQHARRALKAAVSSEAWQTVIQLVRLETDVTRRDSLFRDMVRQQQWAVCRELLDQGVSDDLCVEALSDLMEHRQWTLVAMVMRCPMSEESRTEMMYRSLMMREGSVVWQCINSLQRPLSIVERENIFQLAFNREVWQAVKPLVEKKDETGIRHRDTALLEAIEQHQWDVVDYCQRHHADINMKDDDGETPLHRAASKEDWEAVKELTVRDGDPNLLDSDERSVLDRAIIAEQWDLVKLLIQFHGDIHLPSGMYPSTAIEMLIDARQIDVIQSTFMWCADQWKGVNKKGETTLHAACLSGCPGILHDLIARSVNPLAVTSSLCCLEYVGIFNIWKPRPKGLSALCYAVMCRECPQRMVAECIELGFSVHQPHITRVVESDWNQSLFPKTEQEKMLTCPLVLAVIRGLPVVTQMLYESGACSNRQLFMLTAHLDISTAETLKSEFSDPWENVCQYDNQDYTADTVLIEKSADYLRQMSSTPRSLVSTCRLVISRCLTLSKTRHRDIAQLPLSPMMKNYLMFTDLTDPDYVGHQE